MSAVARALGGNNGRQNSKSPPVQHGRRPLSPALETRPVRWARARSSLFVLKDASRNARPPSLVGSVFLRYILLCAYLFTLGIKENSSGDDLQAKPYGDNFFCLFFFFL